jgi:pimeloyl-ACP methyl ester carboxylesterase
MLSELAATRPDAVLYNNHDPIIGVNASPTCMCLKHLPTPYARIDAGDMLIDFREPAWGLNIKRKRLSEILLWVRQATRALPGQSRDTGVAKGVSESAVSLVLPCLFAASLLFFLFAALRFVADLPPNVVVRTEYVLATLTQWALAEMIVTAMYENYILKNRVRFLQLGRERDIEKIAKIVAEMVLIVPHLNLRSSWKWLIFVAITPMAVLMLSHFSGGNMPAAVFAKVSIWPPLSLWALVIARRLPRLFPKVVLPFSDLAGYSNDEQVMAEIREYLAQFIARLLEATNQDGQYVYDELHLVGHSMGNVIIFESLYDVWRLCAQGSLGEDAFKRIKTFTSLGSPLEKMGAHFRVESILKGETDVSLRWSFARERFTMPHRAGNGVIAWRNVYYLWDVVADPVLPRDEDCENIRLSFPRIDLALDLHGAYVYDSRVARLLVRMLGSWAEPLLCYRVRLVDIIQRSLKESLISGHTIRIACFMIAVLGGLRLLSFVLQRNAWAFIGGGLVFLLALMLLLIELDDATEPAAEQGKSVQRQSSKGSRRTST